MDKISETAIRILRTGTPVLLVGGTGVGKTSRVRQMAEELGWPLFETPPVSTMQPEDFLGVPFPDEASRSTDWLPARFWRELAEAGKKGPVLLFLDEINRAAPATQNALFPLIFGAGGVRRAGEIEIPDSVRVIAAANPPEYQVFPLGQALVARFAIIRVEPDPAAWQDWAVQAGIHPDILGFIRESPELLNAEPDAAEEAWAALSPAPTPRAWEYASRLLTAAGEAGPGEVHRLVASAVGERAATAFLTWREALAHLPDPEDLLAGRAELPESPARALVAMTRATDWAVEKAQAQEAVDPVVALFRAAASWAPELVAGVMVPRLAAAKGLGRALGGPRWILQVIQKAPEFLKAHGDVLRGLQGMGGR